jgi:hypothetical protein
MAENEEDYALVRALLDRGGSFQEEREAIKALDRIRQNREWEVKRAYNKGQSDAEEHLRSVDAGSWRFDLGPSRRHKDGWQASTTLLGAESHAKTRGHAVLLCLMSLAGAMAELQKQAKEGDRG